MSTKIAVPDDRNGPRRLVPTGLAGLASSSSYTADYEDSDRFSVAGLLQLVQEWRWLILGAIALGLAGGVVAALLTKPLYRAGVTLEVNAPTVEILDDGKDAVFDTRNLKAFIQTQIGLLKSRSVAERVAEDLNLANNPGFVGQQGDAVARLEAAAGKVAAGLQVQPLTEEQLIKFAYVSERPELAAQVANGIADSFISQALQRRFEASSYARTFLQQQVAKTRRDLERSERALVLYAQRQGIIDTSRAQGAEKGSDASTLSGESLIALNAALAEATAKRVQAEGAYRQAGLTAPSSDANANTQALQQAQAALEAEYREKRVLMKPQHPDMLSLRSRINEIEQQIARATSRATSSSQNNLLGQYRAAAAAERELQQRVAQLKATVLSSRGTGIQYNILQREVDTNRALYDALLQRYKEIGVAGGIGTTPISIVDRAKVPGGPFKPNLLNNLLVGLILGLVGGLGAAVFLELVNDTIKTREDVRTKLGLACLGSIPKRRGKQPVIDDLSDPGSATSEAYSAVVSSLKFSTEGGAPKTLLISSGRPSEGKSSSAFAIAQIYARGGARVLLIDGDLRRPAFVMDDSNQGLTKLLTIGGPLEEQITPTEHDNLWLLPAGPTPPNPADLLSTSRIKTILAEATASFDHVIVDGPPALGLADVTLLAAVARNVLLVIESGKTRTRVAREAIERFQVAGANILGVTLTKTAEERSYAYGYGYGGSRYGSQLGAPRTRIRIARQPSTG